MPNIRNVLVIFTIVFLVLPLNREAGALQYCGDNDAEKAEKTLITFFTYLHEGEFSKAVLLFEPWEEGVGESKSSWEGLASFSPAEDRNDKSKVLANYCKMGTCLRAEVISIERIAEGKYKLRVQFFKDNGSVYVYTPCCGATEEEMPLRAVFDYFVHKINGVYKVRTPPLFRP